MACPVTIAVVTAVMGTRDFVFAPPPQPCAEYFLFTNWTRVESANASRWTVVTPHRRGGRRRTARRKGGAGRSLQVRTYRRGELQLTSEGPAGKILE